MGMNVTVGIDPGQKGALAFLYKGHQKVYPMPVQPLGGKKRICAGEIARIFTTEHRGTVGVTVWVEEARALPKQGVVSTLSIGVGYGILLGVIETLGYRYQVVNPRTWQAEMLKGLPRRKRTEIKQASKEQVRRLFPKLDIKGDGAADALLIAEYGRRRG